MKSMLQPHSRAIGVFAGLIPALAYAQNAAKPVQHRRDTLGLREQPARDAEDRRLCGRRPGHAQGVALIR